VAVRQARVEARCGTSGKTRNEADVRRMASPQGPAIFGHCGVGRLDQTRVYPCLQANMPKSETSDFGGAATLFAALLALTEMTPSE